MQFHSSAHRHGHDEQAIFHAIRNALTVIVLEPEADPPKVLGIGPDPAGNLLEVVWLELDGEAELVIHAMPLRPSFYDLLPAPNENDS